MIITKFCYPKENVNRNCFKPANQCQSVVSKNCAIPVRELSSNNLKGAYGLIGLNKSEMTNKISFTSNPLYKINLKKLMPDGSYSFIPASFSELVKKDPKDMDAIFKLKKMWEGQSEYGEYISNGYLESMNNAESFFAIEINDPKLKPQERISCLMETAQYNLPENNDCLDIMFLQSAPEIAYKRTPKIKGSGELSLYGVVRVAKEKGLHNVRVVSFNDSFYKKCGFKKIEGYDSEEFSVYGLNSTQFDSFLDKVSKKYGLK